MHECMHAYICACTHVHVSSTHVRMHGVCVCACTYKRMLFCACYLAQGDLNYRDLVVE